MRDLILRMVYPALNARTAIPVLALLAGLLLAVPPVPASTNTFVFDRTDYMLESHLNGLDSVAVADVDGQKGPDIIIVSLTAGSGAGILNILLNNGDGSFAAPRTFETCAGAKSVVVGQFNPSTDSLLDVAMMCGGSTLLGRMLGDGSGDFEPAQTIDLGYLGVPAGTGHPYISIIEMLRLGSMNGPTFAYAGYMAGLGFTLCIFGTLQLEIDLDGVGNSAPICNISLDAENNIIDWGPISTDLALGEQRTFPDDNIIRDEAFSFNGVAAELAITAYTPQFADNWADGYRPFGAPGDGTAVAVADVNNDGMLDVILGGDFLIADYLPAYPASATPDHSFLSIKFLYDMTTADFNGDGNIDIAALGDDNNNDDDATLAIHAGRGDGTFAPLKRFVTRGYWSLDYVQVMATGDFDQNGLPDIVTVGRYDNYASVLINRSPLFINGFEADN
jgi:hypothetical protein